MQIKNRLYDNLIACTQLNPQLVPALGDGVTKGPFQIAQTLEQVAAAVAVSNLNANDATNTSHARPTMFSGVSGFVDNVKAVISALSPGAADGAAANLTDIAKQDFYEWQGMIAAVALSNVYCGMGLNLSVDQVDIQAGGNVAMECVLQEMKKEHCYSQALNGDAKGVLYYICQNGEPFAIFHPEIGLCPMRQYDRKLFAGVLDWYDETKEDCHAAWKDILSLGEYCLSRIAWWAGQNHMLDYQQYLCAKVPGCPVLNMADAIPDAIPGSTAINGVPAWAGKGNTFGTTMMAYRDAAGNAQKLPELFLDTMFITYVGDAAQNKLVYNSAEETRNICFTGDNGALATYAPVPPFYKEIMEVLEKDTLTSLCFRANLDTQQRLESVDVELNVCGLMLRHRYTSEKLRLGQIPYLMMWPFVPMPTGRDLWRSYYATWRPQKQGIRMLTSSNGKIIPLAVGKPNFRWDVQNHVHEVFISAENKWPVCIGSKPFRYAVLISEQEKDGVQQIEEMGLIFMPKYPFFDPATANRVGATPVKLAIDFGTTSTVCALQSPLLGNTGKVTLPFMDYSKCVTCDEPAVAEDVNIYSWLGNTTRGANWSWNRKLFSVAQLFSRNGSTINRDILPDADKQEYYADGRLMMGDAIVHMDLNAGNQSDPLAAQQIMTDMKFNHQLNVANYHAASLYLAGVYSYAVLYLLSKRVIPGEGSAFLELRASYPNETTLNALKDNWRYAQSILGRIMHNDLTAPLNAISYFAEATAATAFNYAKAAFNNGLISMDIGGGTTDISISNNAQYPNDVRNLSVRYAGREVMVSSLLEFYRHINPIQPAVVGADAFDKLWPEDCRNQAILFRTLCTNAVGKANISAKSLHDLNDNNTLRMIVEMLLNKGLELPHAAPASPTALPQQLIAMKFFMLLDVVAKAVRKNLDLWKDPNTQKLLLSGDRLEINLAVSGTGAQLLQHVFNCPTMKALENLQTPSAIGEDRMRQCLSLMNTIFYEELKSELPEGVFTDLKIHVDKNVAEKLDVSYGMLDNVITNLNAQAPVAAQLLPGKEAAPVAATTQSSEALDQKTQAMQQMISVHSQESLDQYIEDLMYYWQKYEQIYFPTPNSTNYGLGDVTAMSKLMDRTMYSAYFNTARAEVSKSRAAYMVAPEQEPYQEQLTCMYLVEEMLNWLIAQNQ